MRTESLTKEVVLNAPVSIVWEAITNKEEMKQWYFDIGNSSLKLVLSFGLKEKKMIKSLCIYVR